MPIIPLSRSHSVHKTGNLADLATAGPSFTSAMTKIAASDVPLSPSHLPVRPTRISSKSQGSRKSSNQPRPIQNCDPAAIAIYDRPSPVAEFQRSRSSLRAKESSKVQTETGRKNGPKHPVTTTSQHARHISTNSSSASIRDSSQGRGRARSSSTLTTKSSRSRPPPKSSKIVDVAIRAPLSIPKVQDLKKHSFSTHQQHYSPLKNPAPKLHPAVFLAPPTPSKWPLNKAISTETAKLQNELLQLHILHKDAGRMFREWRASAKNSFRSRFNESVLKEQRIRQNEEYESARLNTIALKEWQNTGLPDWSLDEKIQMISEIMMGVLSIEEEGGKYNRTIQIFHNWITAYQNLVDERTRNNEDYRYMEDIVLEDIKATWKDDCFALCHKLEGWKRNLIDLGIPQTDSSLRSAIDLMEVMVSDMLAELSLMTQLQEEVTTREHEWIKEMNDEFTEDESNDGPVAGASWRSI